MRNYFIILFLAIGIAACKKHSNTNDHTYRAGILITNEGIFGQTSGTISFYKPETKTVSQDIFRAVNQRDLGNVVQSLTIHLDKVYIVVNNSNKVEIVDRTTFAEKGQITGLELPRYMVPISDSVAYISQWGADGLTGSIKVVSLNTLQIKQTIPLYKGTERLFWIPSRDKVVAVHSGGYDYDNKVVIINTLTHTVDTVYNVPDNPNSLQYDLNAATMWIACAGHLVYSNYPAIDTAQSTAPALVSINLTTKQITNTTYLTKGNTAKSLVSDFYNHALYFINTDGIYKFNTSTQQSQQIIAGNYYGLGFDYYKSELYTARLMGIEPATIGRYSINNYALIDSFKAGIFANDFVVAD